MRFTDRRERLLAFIQPWADCRRQYACRMGDARLPFECLTDQALEALADRICRDFWFERKLNRRNRAIHAARAA